MISDAEMVTLAVMQALLGHTSEARWLRFADEHLRHLFPYLPQQPGYNKRLRRLAATLNWLLGALARDTSVWTDDVVRHEALLNRAVVKGHRLRLVAVSRKKLRAA